MLNKKKAKKKRAERGLCQICPLRGRIYQAKDRLHSPGDKGTTLIPETKGKRTAGNGSLVKPQDGRWTSNSLTISAEEN